MFTFPNVRAHHLRQQRQVLDVAGSSTADGARIVQATADGRTSQQWRLRPLTGGQYSDRGATNQQWTFSRVTS
ncbi:hypothetical protein TUSST3_16170 [Streptomyces sp. TUS-ST3]|jgi:hypothetical protein|uniref:RICIN domain-containing protein n=1 Tax=Streptomyces sp. TUS-ST3 TaxID=3025591 RepID=UPI00235B3FC3|nr:RICIN domain-containing protein [Streptomyces sp. TUS-ST3]GLP64997.1 hypothetical protein TUSST3_16170 [Streptomyces sp. TUS-ST3]